ncbi:MAG TPA: hypothetical protein VFB14_09995 [Bryobacteraceae bacterium]|nr:hypothetical protein [Bryobacteraceae bacterium]
MPSTRRDFLLSSALAAAATKAGPLDLTGTARARRHRIVRNLPTPDFFEGMLLGNGDIGVCVTARPDALGLHIGKSDSWDIRVSEDNYSHVLTFAELLKLWQRASDEAKRQGKPDLTYLEREIPFFREYTEKVAASYAEIWPRPWPCGIVWIHWDPNQVRVKEQALDPAFGHYSLNLETSTGPVQVQAFVNTTTGHVCIWSDAPGHFESVVYYPNIDEKAQLPAPKADAGVEAGSAWFSGSQLFPATVGPNPPPSPKDRNMALYGRVQGEWTVEGKGLRSKRPQQLRIDIGLFTPRDHPESVRYAADEAQRLSKIPVEQIQKRSNQFWFEYWSQSAVEFADEELERWWYHNQYWLACCLRPGKIAPGLFGNWTSGHIGTAWHGDYHMNYNTQQVFWGVFSSNHVEQHLPYIELVESLLAMSENYAREKFGLPGAYFPHSAYPVPSQVVPYPAPPWGYEICETPWVVQSLWWHYLYTQDEQILRRVYPLLRAAADFIAAYVKRGSDGKYHVIPTVSPENWGCTVDFRLNRDCIMDLALIDFLLEAVVKGSKILKTDADRRERWSHIRSNLAPYPRAGDVWVDVRDAPVGWIYNIPVTLAPVFPGERVGLHSSDAELALARRTARTIRLEGGNDIVYQPLIRARLGMLDLDWFKREVRYCLMPNGIVQDRVRQTGGRYKDTTDFDFMMRMGVWTENLSLPAVLNECLLQSYTGTLRLFPNTQNLGPAWFRNLRAVGAFLVSAAWDGKTVSQIEIVSERGATARLVNPWKTTGVRVTNAKDNSPIEVKEDGPILEFATQPGERYRIDEQH